MKRSDIRNSTIILILFTITAFTLIMVFYKIPSFDKFITKEEPGEQILWSDTLTNKSSNWAPLAKMDRNIENFMQKWEIKGLSLAITRHDSLLYAKGFGWSSIEDSTRMTPGTIMRIASASKLVTAVAIMKLAEEGKLSLDSKVFGPEGILNDTAYTNAIRDKRALDITVDHLLQHKGGFTLGAGDPMFNTAEIIKAKNLSKAPSNEKLVEIVLDRRLGFQPGSGRRYSNFGYMLLSLIIEKLSGESYWDYVSGNILHPIGAYKFRPGTNYLEERHPDETKYYGPDTVKVEEFNGSGRMVDNVYGARNIHGLSGAGGWVTTASDLARLVAAIDGEPEVKDILNKESIRLMTYSDEDDKQTRGWVDSDGKGKWTRTGTLNSTHVLITRFANGECWVMMTNSGVWTGPSFSRDMARLIDRLRAQYGDDLPRRNLW